MVGKLLKHDLISLFRMILYLSCFAIGFAIISRILMATEQGITILFVILSLYISLALVFAAFIGSIVRFYKSLFTGEGYMTFSLPVSVTKLLISKLLSAFIATLAGIVVFVVCFFIIMSGIPAESFEEVMEIIEILFDELGAYMSYDPLLTVEFILLIIISVPMGLLQYFVCLSLGQMFSKHRVGWSVGIIILSNVVLSILSSYCLNPILNAAMEFNVHLALWLNIIVYAGLDVGYFFLTRYLLTHKLNLLV